MAKKILKKGRVIVLRSYHAANLQGREEGPESVSGPSVLARLAVLEFADVVDNGLAEAVDVHSRAVVDTVAG